MKKVKEIFSLIFIVFVNFTFADVFFNVVNREDPCVNLCEKTPLTISNAKYMKSCCQRGCRFFNLVDVSQGFINDGFNGTTVIACEACKFDSANNFHHTLSDVNIIVYDEI